MDRAEMLAKREASAETGDAGRQEIMISSSQGAVVIAPSDGDGEQLPFGGSGIFLIGRAHV